MRWLEAVSGPTRKHRFIIVLLPPKSSPASSRTIPKREPAVIGSRIGGLAIQPMVKHEYTKLGPGT